MPRCAEIRWMENPTVTHIGSFYSPRVAHGAMSWGCSPCFCRPELAAGLGMTRGVLPALSEWCGVPDSNQ